MNITCGRKDIERNDFVFGEYHAHGMPVGMYMIKWNNWKYVYYVGYKPQLFDLDKDPDESKDLLEIGCQSDEIRLVLAECEKRLRMICDPEEVDRRAKDFQSRCRKRFGLELSDAMSGEYKRINAVPHPEYIF